MTDNKKTEVDAETILLTLDQVSQTIDIMTNVVGKLRNYVTEQSQPTEPADSLSSNEYHALQQQRPPTLH